MRKIIGFFCAEGDLPPVEEVFTGGQNYVNFIYL